MSYPDERIGQGRAASRRTHRSPPAGRGTAAIMLLAMLFPGSAPGAPQHEDLERIRLKAEAHARRAVAATAPDGARLEIEASRLDPRLRLPACDEPLQAFSPPGNAQRPAISVGIRCAGAPGWSLFVPVRARVMTDVLVLRVSLGRGQTVSGDHLQSEPRDIAALPAGYFRSKEDVVGLVLRRHLQAGTELTPAMLERPRLVERGQRVRILSAGSSYNAWSEGEALANAAEGDRLRVRNTHSRLVVEGVVSADGTVHVRN